MQVDTRVDVFEEIFLVFLGLGTLVGIIVVAYTLYNAYKYRDDGSRDADDDLPTLGELPTGGGSGKKLFVSFFLSAIVVISLIVWTYGMLLYVEDGPDEIDEDTIEVDVDAATFFFQYTYDNGIQQGPSDPLVVPAGEPVALSVTSNDVWHTFGISQERVKADAIPGEVDETWFAADSEPGTYENAIECFELCGPGHSSMQSDLRVLEDQEAYDDWVADQLMLNLSVVTEEEVDSGEENETETEEVPVTEDFELELEYADDTGVYSETYTQDDAEDGTITVDDIEQGGTYNVTVTPADEDQYEVYEGQIDHTGSDGGVQESITLQQPADEGGEN